MSRALNDLSSQMRPLAFELLARLVEQGVAVMIVDTLRTPEEHALNLANGSSATKLSRHLPRGMRATLPIEHPERDKSDAMDICPYELYALVGPDKLKWESSHPVWITIGRTAESLGLVWGGRWTSPHDPGHVELPSHKWRP